MKQTNYNLQRYDADDGKVFDWKNIEEHKHEEINDEGKTVIVYDHLYVKTLFIGELDSIDNYIEVDEVVKDVSI